MAVPLLEVRGLVKAYGGRNVLDGVDLVVTRGETIVVIGGSGSGKTTLARLLVGLEMPTAGQILLDGKDLAALTEHELAHERTRFAMVFQKFGLLDSMNVFDNVAFPLRERGHVSEAEIARRVTAQLEALGVADAARKLPAELSGGMAKRVGIARAMVIDPEILVYDEPTSGLDPVTSRLVDELIEEVRLRYLVTSIVITHDMATAYGIADRVVLLDRGRIAVDGPPEVVLASDDRRIRPFVESSGIDPSRLLTRDHRMPPAEIRARWEARAEERRAEASSHARPSLLSLRS